jgi:hypothetical protein
MLIQDEREEYDDESWAHTTEALTALQAQQIDDVICLDGMRPEEIARFSKE